MGYYDHCLHYSVELHRDTNDGDFHIVDVECERVSKRMSCLSITDVSENFNNQDGPVSDFAYRLQFTSSDQPDLDEPIFCFAAALVDPELLQYECLCAANGGDTEAVAWDWEEDQQ